MIKSILKSKWTKLFSLFLAISTLTMSFSIKGEPNLTLIAGSIISVESANELNSETLISGQSIDFFVTDDVKVNNQTVVKRGAIARGQVIRVSKAKGLGKEGLLEVEIKSVEAVDGSQVRLTSTRIFEEGEDKQTVAILLGVLVCILFLTKKGKNAIIPPGHSIDGRVAQDVQITV